MNELPVTIILTLDRPHLQRVEIFTLKWKSQNIRESHRCQRFNHRLNQTKDHWISSKQIRKNQTQCPRSFLKIEYFFLSEGLNIRRTYSPSSFHHGESLLLFGITLHHWDLWSKRDRQDMFTFALHWKVYWAPWISGDKCVYI